MVKQMILLAVLCVMILSNSKTSYEPMSLLTETASAGEQIKPVEGIDIKLTCNDDGCNRMVVSGCKVFTQPSTRVQQIDEVKISIKSVFGKTYACGTGQYGIIDDESLSINIDAWFDVMDKIN